MGKKVLVVGSGGREHALCWKIAQSPEVSKVYCAPGNAGIAQAATCVEIPAEDVEGLVRFAHQEKIDLAVVGPELPLTLGLVDRLTEEGIKAFGPTKAAAELEGSKAFAKDLMREAGVPTADYQVFEDAAGALRYFREKEGKVAIKVSGLASGKGVILPQSIEEGVEAIDRIFTKREFGDAGTRVVIEEFLEGEELSLLALCDGTTALPLEGAQDHKALLDGDQGPNTGGMGAYCPAPILTPALLKQIDKDVLKPTLRTLKKMGRPFKGVLYAGLMITKDGPKVLEYNARFGDPECQPLLMRMDSDLVPLLEACADGILKGKKIDWKREAAVSVVMASKGYPGSYEKGKEITGLDQVAKEGVQVFHSGTKRSPEGKILTNGGRVLAVTALGLTLKDAVDRAYENVRRIQWEGAQYRTDIARKGLRRLKELETEAPLKRKTPVKKALLGLKSG
ncbi:MAG: phosphoribosylamine--glycine ligase [Bdellovibrionota bacterium]